MSVLSEMMEAAKTRIQTKITDGGLPGFPGSANVSSRAFIDAKNVEFPHIFITPVGSESTMPGDNLHDDWIRPILVTIAIRDHEDSMDLTIFDWREALLKLFRTRSMRLEVPGQYRLEVQPGNQIEIITDQYQYILSSFTLLPTTREDRGS